MAELTSKAKAHRDGLQTAFDPLYGQIESLKANFWKKNSKAIQDVMERYLVEEVKQRVDVEVNYAPSVFLALPWF